MRKQQKRLTLRHADLWTAAPNILQTFSKKHPPAHVFNNCCRFGLQIQTSLVDLGQNPPSLGNT